MSDRPVTTRRDYPPEERSAGFDRASAVADAMTPPEPTSLRARSLFLSDIHLGTRACRAEQLLSLLKEYECE